MRPLTLRLRGVRSYLAERTVNFTELGLVAIIGPTGAGKSSLLEAMTYALYGGCTWDQRGGKALIADTANTMTVQLTFEADDKTWKVTRTTSRGTYPPPSFGLMCLSDPDEPKVDGEDNVNARIAQLVGLDFHSFCSCVLLPQGRFEALLKARPSDRAKILEHIFGLDELTDLREAADTALATVRGRREQISRQRAKFLYDPRAELLHARAQLDRVEPMCEALGRDVERIVELREQARRHQADAERLKLGADRVDELHRGPLERLHELAVRGDELQSARVPLAEAFECAQAADEHARGREAAARTKRRDEASIAVAQSALEAARDELDTIATAESALKADDDAYAHDLATHQRETGKLEQLARAAKQAGKTLLQIHERLTAKQTAAETLEAHRIGLREALDTHNARADELKAAQLRAAQAAQEHHNAESAVREAEERLGKCERELTALRHAHAVADLAEGCRPGDPCPVCERELPAAFAVKPAADLTEARNAREQSSKAATKAQRQAAALQSTWQAATNALLAAEGALGDAATLVHTKQQNGIDALALGDLDAQATMEELDRRSAATVAQLRGLQEADEEARRCEQTAREAHTTLLNDHSRQGAALGERSRALAHRRRELALRRESLPGRLADLPDWAHPQTLATTALAAALSDVYQARREAEALARKLDESHQALTSAHNALEGHDQRARAAVAEPALAERETLRTLVRALAEDGVAALAEPPRPGAPLPRLLAWGQEIGASAERHATAMRQQAEDVTERATQATKQGHAILERHGAPNSPALERRLRELEAERLAANNAHDRAAGQIAGADVLDTLKRQATDFEQGLQELHDLLTRGRFIGHVISVRQRALLILASGVLAQVTGGRFGFTSAFQMIDTRSGLARKPETLSGGETFLASLALALGLVELMGRAGGQLRALFLDEGFGSLDPNTLDEALDALEARARAGQLIAIISHVPAVAERIESVLQVVPRPEGSEVIPLDATARERLADQEAEDLALT